MRQIQHYQFDAPRCALFETQSRTTLVVGQGRLWVTVEGERTDHWLAVGDTLDVAPRQRVWLGAEAGNARLTVLQDRPPTLVARIARASARHLRRAIGVGRENRARRLNPGA